MKKILLLFDVDGTLTIPRQVIKEDMLDILKTLSFNKSIDIGFVGGSDVNKQKEQLLEENFYLFHWRFSENGLTGFYNDELIHKRSFVDAFGEENTKELINICLSVLSETNCPKKRGTFIEFRNGMINISPVGRSCSQSERIEFNEYDILNHTRENMIDKIKTKWEDFVNKNKLENILNLKFSIGGEISVDLFPEGWDKTYCLQFVKDKYEEIHFFGDKTEEGGNDYEIYNSPHVIGHKVLNYHETISVLQKLFL